MQPTWSEVCSYSSGANQLVLVVTS